MYKKCSRCKTEKSVKEFSKNISKKDKLCDYCRLCSQKSLKKLYLIHRDKRIEYNKKYNKKNPQKRNSYMKKQKTKNPIAYKARYILNNAVKLGKIIKKPCENCGNIKSYGHHDDYSKPLEVIWLCDYHHKIKHGKISFFMRKIRAYIIFKKEPFIARSITFHRDEAEKKLTDNEEIMECVVSIPLPDEKLIENIKK